MKKQVLLIEDDDALRTSLAQSLDLEGITVIQANGFAQARRTIRANFAGVILSDIRMPHKDGFDVLSYAQSVDKELPVVMLTGEADVPMALRAMKEGAYDFLEKPCTSSELLDVLTRTLHHRALVTRNRQMEQLIKRNDAAAVNFPGPSQITKDLRSNLRQVAPLPVHIHLYGEIGSGRRLAAHTIHSLSHESDVFISFNLKEPLETLELPNSPLTLSLKNLNTLAPSQENILKLLKDNPDIRLITSSNQSIGQLKNAGINENLFSTLNPIEINIPSLAQRRKDLPVLFEYLLRLSARTLNIDMPKIPQSVYAQVISKDWPGNLPALRDFATTIAVGLTVHQQQNDALTLTAQMDTFERLVLIETLKRNNGKAVEAAQSLGLPHKTFYDRLARYDLRPKDFKGE